MVMVMDIADWIWIIHLNAMKQQELPAIPNGIDTVKIFMFSLSHSFNIHLDIYTYIKTDGHPVPHSDMMGYIINDKVVWYWKKCKVCGIGMIWNDKEDKDNHIGIKPRDGLK